MILHVVDFPLVPVTTIDFILGYIKKNKSRSVIILCLFLNNALLIPFFLMLIPGLIIM